MLGYSHAISGLVTGAAAGEFVLHASVPQTVALAVFTAGWATVPDLDTCQSCAARSLGFLSQAFAWVVGRISGGHRHGSHSVVGVAVITAVTWLAAFYRHDWPGRIALWFLLAVAFAAGLRALRIGGHTGDLVAIGAAGWVTVWGWELTLIPLACALGCATHLAGDALTKEGIPVLWPFSGRHFGLPSPLSFTTGTWRERLVVAPLLLVALGFLSWHAVTQAGVLA